MRENNIAKLRFNKNDSGSEFEYKKITFLSFSHSEIWPLSDIPGSFERYII